MKRSLPVRARILLLLASVSLCALTTLGLEALVRAFGDVQILGNSRNLFLPNAFGPSRGNARNTEAVSFGTRVFTDANGFRVPAATPDDDQRSTFLLLGDSVAFGPGVEEPETLAGRLRKSLPGTRILNASVIGYGAEDYRNFLDHFLSGPVTPGAVFLVFCLNDISSASARLLPTARNDGEAGGEGGLTSLRRISILNRINGFLRPRSHLYLLAKNILTDPQRRYWLSDAALYERDDPQLGDSLQPIVDMAGKLQKRDVPFTIILVPYEYQLRTDTTEVWLPQRRLSSILGGSGLRVVDSSAAFRHRHLPSRTYFLTGDPMHLSAAGHAVLHGVILDQLGSGIRRMEEENR